MADTTDHTTKICGVPDKPLFPWPTWRRLLSLCACKLNGTHNLIGTEKFSYFVGTITATIYGLFVRRNLCSKSDALGKCFTFLTAHFTCEKSLRKIISASFFVAVIYHSLLTSNTSFEFIKPNGSN